MKKHMHYFSAFTALGLVLGVATPGLAQDQRQPAPADGAISDIVVTARQRAEPLQRTPVSVSALTADDIAAKVGATIVDLGRSMPNVRIDALGRRAAQACSPSAA